MRERREDNRGEVLHMLSVPEIKKIDSLYQEYPVSIGGCQGATALVPFSKLHFKIYLQSLPEIYQNASF